MAGPLPAFLQGFDKSHRNIRLEFTQGSEPEIEAALVADTLSFGLGQKKPVN